MGLQLLFWLPGESSSLRYILWPLYVRSSSPSPQWAFACYEVTQREEGGLLAKKKLFLLLAVFGVYNNDLQQAFH